MFSSSKNILITGGSFSQVNHWHVKSPFEKLQDAASPAAFHNSAARFDPPKCYPNTRLAILDRIMQWILGNEHSDELIMWLYGSAGAGKSAIAQSIAEQCATNHILLSSFFFSRTDSTRNHANSLFPTLAYQIASDWIYPEARVFIEALIEKDPQVFSRSIEVQLESLIIGPLRRIFETTPSTIDSSLPRHLIIIDGLDECLDSDARCAVLNAIASTKLTQQRGRLPLIFLIASRPEQDITITFNQISTIPPEHRVVMRLALDDSDSYRHSADIELFLRDKFKQIRNDHPLNHSIPPSWPSDTAVRQLVTKSSGQFIYASTVVRYVKSIRHRPMDRLEEVLGIRSGNDSSLPFVELDALYAQILSSVEDIELVYDIFALMMIPDTFTNLNDMEKFLFLSPGDIELLFGNLRSIISCPLASDYLGYRNYLYSHMHEKIHSSYAGLKFLHASLPDFLLDEARSKDLFINPGLRHSRLLDYCMRHLHIDPFTPVRYVEWHITHFCSMAAPTADLHQKIWNFSFLHYRDNALNHVIYSVNIMENFLSGIKKLKFDDADEMYNHHLKQFDQFWMSILGEFFTEENPKFDFLLLFAQYGLHWRVNLNSVQEGMDAEDLVMELNESGISLPSLLDASWAREFRSFTIDVNSEFWQFLEDPCRSGRYAINGTKYATAALVYFKCLAKDEFRCRHRMLTHLHFFFNQSAKLDELVDLVLQVRWHLQGQEFRTHRPYPERLKQAIREYVVRTRMIIP